MTWLTCLLYYYFIRITFDICGFHVLGKSNHFSENTFIAELAHWRVTRKSLNKYGRLNKCMCFPNSFEMAEKVFLKVTLILKQY